MSRMLVFVLVAGFVLAPSALGDGGPSPGVTADGKLGLTDRRSGLTYMALSGTTDTFVIVRDRSGRQVRSAVVAGSWGIPFVTWTLTPGGLSYDGTRLVLAAPPSGRTLLARRSRVLVLDTRTLRAVRRVALAGDFAFDALSPDGRTLFLIQHSSASDVQRYRVRAYDLERGSLDPQAIVDKSEPKMAGMPLRRLVGPSARWIYTLYMHGNEYFVHALDTVHARTRCLDISWSGSPNALANATLTLRGKRLALLGRDGTEVTSIALPGTNGTKPWKTAAGTAAALAATLLGIAALIRFRRARRSSNSLLLSRFERPQSP